MTGPQTLSELRMSNAKYNKIYGASVKGSADNTCNAPTEDHLERQQHICLDKIGFMCTHVLSVFLYACETWTLTGDLQKRIQAMEMRCL